MKKVLVACLLLIVVACQKSPLINTIVVNDIDELNHAIATSQPGDEIVLKNGIWNDVEIVFSAEGTKEAPIVLRAETPGKVSIEGRSNLKIGGEYLVVSGLHFKNGFTPSESVIQFKVSDDKLANHCKVTNCVIEDFTQANRENSDHWVEFWGRYNELSHNYITGKSNFGPTVMVMLKGNASSKTYHQIVNNHFGPRPRKGGPHGETLQIGDSGTSMVPAHVNVSNNLFDRCNGEVEIISSKSNYNEFRNNVFFESEGSLVLRHGNYATIDGNMFIGNANSKFIGGIRVINTGHWITNNYFYKLQGEVFRAPLAMMNGIPKSPQNRYNQVTDVVVAYNSFVDCLSPWQFSVGSNVDQSEVLPKSEIRSARPIRTIVANNILYNDTVFEYPIKNYDTVDGVLFETNYSNHQNKSEVKPEGLMTTNMQTVTTADGFSIPLVDSKKVYSGFDFETIKTDLLGNQRTEDNNKVGAVLQAQDDTVLFDRSDYGTNWFSPKGTKTTPKTVSASNAKELKEQLYKVNSGDTIVLQSGNYVLDEKLVVNKAINIRSANKSQPSILKFNSKDMAFEMHPKGRLWLDHLILEGETTNNAFQTLNQDMSMAYNLFLNHVEIGKFNSVLEVSKGSFADTISVANSLIKDCNKGFELHKETDNKGDYNIEFLIIENSTFNKVNHAIVDYHRGGYDESTIGGNFIFKNNTVEQCGALQPDDILIKNRGIVNVTFANNTFINNPVDTIAILWGEKGQKPENNTIKQSGKIEIVQNLKLNLMY